MRHSTVRVREKTAFLENDRNFAHSFGVNHVNYAKVERNFNFLLQTNVNEMNKLKHGMVRDEVTMNNRMEWS